MLRPYQLLSAVHKLLPEHAIFPCLVPVASNHLPEVVLPPLAFLQITLLYLLILKLARTIWNVPIAGNRKQTSSCFVPGNDLFCVVNDLTGIIIVIAPDLSTVNT